MTYKSFLGNLKFYIFRARKIILLSGKEAPNPINCSLSFKYIFVVAQRWLLMAFLWKKKSGSNFFVIYSFSFEYYRHFLRALVSLKRILWEAKWINENLLDGIRLESLSFTELTLKLWEFKFHRNELFWKLIILINILHFKYYLYFRVLYKGHLQIMTKNFFEDFFLNKSFGRDFLKFQIFL